MRGEVGKKHLKKRWIIPHFYDVTWLIFETRCPTTNFYIVGLETYYAKSIALWSLYVEFGYRFHKTSHSVKDIFIKRTRTNDIHTL